MSNTKHLETQEELRFRQPTFEDRFLSFQETVTKTDWLLHPETRNNPAAEGKQIAKLLYEGALKAGGHTKYILEKYFPDHFKGCRDWEKLELDEPADSEITKYKNTVSTPFFKAALETFREMNVARKKEEEKGTNTHWFGEEEAVKYFKNLGVVVNPRTLSIMSYANRCSTPSSRQCTQNVL